MKRYVSIHSLSDGELFQGYVYKSLEEATGNEYLAFCMELVEEGNEQDGSISILKPYGEDEKSWFFIAHFPANASHGELTHTTYIFEVDEFEEKEAA